MLTALRLTRRTRTTLLPVAVGTLRFPWLGLMLAVPLATLWTAAMLTQNDLEMQSIDLCHHAMFVNHLQTPFASFDLVHITPYPILSHRVATLWMPLFRNPIMAVRAAALVSLLVMLIAQWHLLRTRLPAAAALLILVAWQCLCTNCKLGNVNHYMWEWQYNYSRAVSGAALWVMLLSFAVPPSRYRLVNVALALGLSAFAFRCHIAAGSVALGAFCTWCVVNMLRRDWRTGLSGIIAVAVSIALLLTFTEEWRYIASQKHENSNLPTRHADLIRLWIPTAVIGLGIALWKSGNALRGRKLTLDLTTVILCGLLPSAALQGYMLYEKNVSQTIGIYAYNQMLFTTFGFATLLWVAGLIALIRRPDRLRHAAVTVAAVLAAAWGLYAMLQADARRKQIGDNRDPNTVLQNLLPHRAAFLGHYYYDPDLELGCYFVSRTVLERDLLTAPHYRMHLHTRKPWNLFREPALRGLFIPLCLDPAKILGPDCPIERVGEFWKCDLQSYRAMPSFEDTARQAEMRK